MTSRRNIRGTLVVAALLVGGGCALEVDDATAVGAETSALREADWSAGGWTGASPDRSSAARRLPTRAGCLGIEGSGPDVRSDSATSRGRPAGSRCRRATPALDQELKRLQGDPSPDPMLPAVQPLRR